MNKQELEEQAEALYTDVRSFLDNTFELIDQIHEPQKVVVPKFVAEWLKEYRHANTLLKVLNAAEDERIIPSAVNDWILDNQRDFVIAWYDGYEVEQEKLYTVEIPNPNAKYSRIVLQRLREDALHLKEYTGDDWKTYKMNQLTEAEIKQDFEWAWDAGFAKEVEEVG
ncbi:TPA: DUF1642 domain-containing protein [Streptococcus suis]|nr:DUF1642 domain-containing protein [Streptococcus suis]HEM4031001.1 DUF1642 domain-containing protein [Streptococcus suis]